MIDLTPDEVPLFLGGLLTAMVLNRAHDVARDLSEDEWRNQRNVFIGTAFDDIVARFPEPLRTRLRSTKDVFVATSIG